MDTKKDEDGRSLRGFGTMRHNPDRMKEVASKGGKRAQELKVAHRFSPKEASEASKKGWKARRAREQAK